MSVPNCFALLRSAMLQGLRDFTDRHPGIFDDLNDDNLRALGREAADRAVAELVRDAKEGPGEPEPPSQLV